MHIVYTYSHFIGSDTTCVWYENHSWQPPPCLFPPDWPRTTCTDMLPQAKSWLMPADVYMFGLRAMLSRNSAPEWTRKYTSINTTYVAHKGGGCHTAGNHPLSHPSEQLPEQLSQSPGFPCSPPIFTFLINHSGIPSSELHWTYLLFEKKGTVCNWSSTIFWYHRTSNKHWSFGCIPSISIQVWKHTKRQCYSQPLDPYHWMTSPSVRKYMSPQTLMAPCN